MPAVLHIWSHDAVAGRGVVDDVCALDDRAGAREPQHRLVASVGLIDDDDRARLAHRLLPARGPAAVLAVGDLAVIDGCRQALRELGVRHGDVVVHAHGPRARGVAALLGVAVIADDGDDRPALRLLPAPTRVVYPTHADLDRGLDNGIGRAAALVPMGVQSDAGAAPSAHVVIADDFGAPHLRAALTRAGFETRSTYDARDTTTARLVLLGPQTRLSHGIAAAIAGGVTILAERTPWVAELPRSAALARVEDVDVDAAVNAAQAAKRRAPKRLPVALRRGPREEALADMYATALGVVPASVGATPRTNRRRR